MCDNNGDTFIATLYNICLAPDLYDGLFLIITLMNLGHTYLFKKKCAVYLGAKEKIRLHYHIVHRGNMRFWGK